MLDTEILEGTKVLNKEPLYLEGKTHNGDKVIEMGTLSNFKRFMKNNKYFKEASHLSSMRDDDDDFSGVSSYDDYLNLLENGDEDVMRKIKVETGKQVAELGKKYEDVLSAYKFDVSGEFFDVGLVLSGVPESWLQPEFLPEERVQVEIIINGTFSSNVRKEMVIKNSSKILAMIKILEENRVEVKLKIVSCIKRAGGDKDLYVATDIKDYDEAINYKKCSALLSPTYLRRGMLKVMEMVYGKKLCGSYGSVISNDNFIDLAKEDDTNALEKRLFRKGK